MLDSKGFDLWADGYDKSVRLSEETNEYPFAGYQEVLNTIYRQIKTGNKKKILDIGFGTGILSKKLYDEGLEIFGIDFSEEMIKRAKIKMPNTVLFQYDFTKGLPLQLDGEKFDAIVSTYAIHHLTYTDQIAFIKELKKHLTSTGEILLGDVAFETRHDLEDCKRNAGEEWDDEEFYPIAEEFAIEFPAMQFQKISFCSGVYMIQ